VSDRLRQVVRVGHYNADVNRRRTW